MKKKTKNQKKILSERFKHLIEREGKPITTIEKETGVNRSTIYKILDAQTYPHEETLGILADHFNVSSEYLKGQSDIEGTRDVEFISTYTGLTPAVVETLHNNLETEFVSIDYNVLANNQMYGLNEILSSNLQSDFLEELTRLIQFSKRDIKDSDILLKDEKNNIMQEITNTLNQIYLYSRPANEKIYPVFKILENCSKKELSELEKRIKEIKKYK